ncbi:MAG: rRNA adenine N-6-methyltransferase family protein [Actinomycetota bacterium]
MAEPRRRWGWHELDRRWADRLVADAGIAPGQLVLDIGAGTGIITASLVAAGARVIAVELHPDRVKVLRRRFTDEPVTVIQVDARALRLPRRPFSVVANPPYHLTTTLVRRLTHPGSALVDAHLVSQAAAVGRLAEAGVKRGRNGRARFVIGAGRPIPRRAFRPPPRVDSRVLIIDRVGTTDRTRRPTPPTPQPGRNRPTTGGP